MTLLFVVSIFFIENKGKNKKNYFSPISIFVYFSILSYLPLVLGAFNVEIIKNYIFSQVSFRYHDIDLIREAYLFTAISILVSYFGIFFGLKNRVGLNTLFNKVFGLQIYNNKNSNIYLTNKENSKRLYHIGFSFVLVGLLIYSYFIYKIGGLFNLWLNLHMRVDFAAGLGYFQQIYSFLLNFGALLCLSISLLHRQYFRSVFLIMLVVFVLASLGQRGPVASFVFSILVVYHLKVKRINIMSVKLALLVFLLISFMLISVQFRTPNAIENYFNNPTKLLIDSSDSFVRHFVFRFSRLERDIVILDYFRENNFWLGTSYYSILTAPIPSSLYLDKPPVDTGRYLNAMAQGEKIVPPVSVRQLPPSSWPDGNWAGYMNFYLPGFIVFFFVSGFIFGWVYQYVKFLRYSSGAVVFYAMIAYGGGVTLSPSGVVNLLMFFFLLFSTTLILRIKF